MSTFSQLAAKNGHGLAWYLDVSTDRFSSVSYRYSSVYGALDGTNQYDPRIVTVTPLARGLGANNLLASSGFSVELANEDGQIDYLLDSLDSVTMKSMWRLTAYLYDPANPSDYATKVLGKFQVSGWPVRTAQSIRLSLSDRMQGEAAEFAMTPTLQDVLDYIGGGLQLVQDNAPVPLVFAREIDRVPAVQLNASVPNVSASSGWSSIYYVVCATTDTAVYSAGQISDAGWGNYLFPGWSYPYVWTWTPSKSTTISKNGKSWKVYLITVSGIPEFWQERLAGNFGIDSWDDPNDLLRKMPPLWVQGWPFSARTAGLSTGSVRAQVAPETAYDLLAYYSEGLTTSDVDLTSFQSVAAGFPGAAVNGRVAGDQIAGRAGSDFEIAGGALRQTISDICGGSFFDVFSAWDGKFYAMSQVKVFDDFATAGSVCNEFEMWNVVERIPSPGERWAPWNRLYLRTDLFGGLTYGPFDHDASISSWGRTIPRTVNARWVSPILQGAGGSLATNASGWASYTGHAEIEGYVQTFQLIPKIRPVIEFDYPLSAVADWEIGTYITVSWTRGGSLSVYSGASFRVEGLTADLENDKARVTAVWIEDSLSVYPWLLDDETYLTVVSAAGGRTVTVTNSSTTATFSSGDLVADGVQRGDILWLLDTTEGSNAFTRFRGLLVDVVHTTYLDVVADSDLAFNAPTGTAVAAWKITRGDYSYPTVASDPTHYPYGGAMYGRAVTYRDDTAPGGGNYFETTSNNKFNGG